MRWDGQAIYPLSRADFVCGYAHVRLSTPMLMFMFTLVHVRLQASIAGEETSSAEQKQMQHEAAAAERLLDDWSAAIGSSGASSRKHHHPQVPPLIAEIDEELGEEEFEDERRREGEEEEEVVTEGQAASLDEFYEAEDDFQFAHALATALESQAVSGVEWVVDTWRHQAGASHGMVEALHPLT